jgi:hypothetical protein
MPLTPRSALATLAGIAFSSPSSIAAMLGLGAPRPGSHPSGAVDPLPGLSPEALTMAIEDVYDASRYIDMCTATGDPFSRMYGGLTRRVIRERGRFRDWENIKTLAARFARYHRDGYLAFRAGIYFSGWTEYFQTKSSGALDGLALALYGMDQHIAADLTASVYDQIAAHRPRLADFHHDHHAVINAIIEEEMDSTYASFAEDTWVRRTGPGTWLHEPAKSVVLEHIKEMRDYAWVAAVRAIERGRTETAFDEDRNQRALAWQRDLKTNLRVSGAFFALGEGLRPRLRTLLPAT